MVGLFVLLANRASTNRLRFVAGPALAAAVLLAAACLPSGFVLRSDFEDRGDTVLFYREDRAGTTKVFRKPDGHLLISVDGNTIGDTRDDLDAKQRLLAHLPLLLVPEPRSALVIGLGSGITAGAMTAHEEVERIDAVEIVPGVVEGALYFAKHNRRALKQPRVDVVVADGINYLLTSERRYDVISSDAKLNPGYTGNAVFLSSDYYRLCLEQLTDRGMMVQWIPLHLPQDSYRMVLRTFAEVFPHGSVWFFPGRHTLLVGTRKQLEIDMDRLLNRLRRPGVGDDLARFGLAHPWALLNGYRGALADIRQFAGSGPLSSWNHPYIEFRTPRGLGRDSAGNRAANLRAVARLRGDVRPYLTGMTGPGLEESQASWQKYARGTDLLLAGLAQAEESGLLSYGEGLFRQALQVHPEGQAGAVLACPRPGGAQAGGRLSNGRRRWSRRTPRRTTTRGQGIQRRGQAVRHRGARSR